MTQVARAINIEDLRSLAHRRLPQVVFDYIDGGAEAEVTMRENRRAFEAITFRPHQAVSNLPCNLRTRVLGQELSMPILLAPVGYCRVMHPDGEIGAARAAGAAGIASVLSTVSGHRLEDVKAASIGPMWYQLYLTGGREAGENALRRARAAGYSALVISIDTNVLGLREREARGGMEVLLRGSPWSKIPYLLQLFAHPRWLTRFLLDGGLPTMPNIVTP
ncbi:MAG: alpha-hydroxy acid oxidase, partial [Terriglobales bacterium]